jgi:hypothetical protein
MEVNEKQTQAILHQRQREESAQMGKVQVKGRIDRQRMGTLAAAKDACVFLDCCSSSGGQGPEEEVQNLGSWTLDSHFMMG